MSHPFDRHGLHEALPPAPRDKGPARIVDLLQCAADASPVSQQPLQNRITCFSDVVHDGVGADALPQLLGAIEPEADSGSGGGGDGAAAANPLAPSAGSLDWGTACVYTCSASCAAADGGEYAEEYVWHQAL